MPEAAGAAGAARADPRDVLRDQVRALYDQAPLGAVIAAVIGCLFVYVFVHVTSPWLLWGWFGASTLSQVVSLWQLQRFRQASRSEGWNPAPWLRRYMARVAAAGMLLGAMPWLFFEPHYGDARWLTVLTICGLAAGSLTSYAYHRPTMFVFLATLTLPAAVRLASLPGQAGWIGSSVFVFYVWMLVWFGHNQARLLRESIEMRHANAALLAQLHQRTLDLEASNRAKSRFFAAASHDLRQPLHALGYYSSLLEPSQHDAPHVQRIEQCIGALDDLLEGVLDIARLDASTKQQHKASVDLGAQLERLAALYGGAASVKGLRLKLHLPRGGAWGHTDEQMLERVLANLVNNAIRYSRRGGLLLAVRPRVGGWGVAVIDTGIGIAADALDTVFDEFVQLHNRQRDPSQGVGLGLATVKRICALLGHEISLRSRLGSGSWFEVRVPRSEALPAAQATLEPATADRLHGRILVVEDNELVGESLRKVLQAWGLECELAGDGEQALALARTQHFDAVLCDWRLPGALDGCEVLQRMGTLQPWLRLQVLLTGERDDEVKGLPGDVPLLRKPVRPIRLRALLTAHLHAPISA